MRCDVLFMAALEQPVLFLLCLLLLAFNSFCKRVFSLYEMLSLLLYVVMKCQFFIVEPVHHKIQKLIILIRKRQNLEIIVLLDRRLRFFILFNFGYFFCEIYVSAGANLV